MCVSVCGYVYVRAGVQGGRGIGPPGVGVMVVVSHLM